MDAIVELDSEFNIIMMNPSGERMFGCRRRDISGTSFTQFIPAKDKRRLEKIIYQLQNHPPDQRNAFVAGPGQGVNYRPGVWHMPLIAFGTGQRFLVIDRGGPGDNCDEHHYQSEEIIVRGSRESTGRTD